MATFLDDRQIVNRAALSALGNTANLTLDVIMGDINTFFANATASATASVLMLRDANANTRANNFIEGFTSTATAAGTTTLTVASTYFQQFTGTTTQTVVLPNATTLVQGQAFLIANRSTGYVTVNANGGGLIQTMAPGSQALLTVTSIGSSAGTWDSAYSVAGPVPFLQTNVTTDSTTTGTAATLLTGDILYGDVRLTNGSLVSVSGIPAGASGQQIIVENQTGNTITINNNDSGATAANRIYTGTGGPVTMSANASYEFIYDTTAARWMLIGGTGSGSGSGGSKNYLSVYTASTASGVPNTGNGNFELGSTTGWSLTNSAITSATPTTTVTAGTAYSAASSGRSAAGTLTFTAVSSGQLGGLYSGNYTDSASLGPTQGDMVISSPFNIDLEDQAKVLTISFSYKNVSGNFTFPGTSSNSLTIWIYDVTNGAWIQPAGVYAMNQNTGVGKAVATFQTTSNSTKYQLAIITTSNPSGQVCTIYYDDFLVGPQTAPSGPAMTDWGNQSWTPTGSWTTNTTYAGKWRRVGDSMEGQVLISLSGAPTGILTVNMPTGYSIDSTKLAGGTGLDSSVNGSGYFVHSGVAYVGTNVEYSSATSLRMTSLLTSPSGTSSPINATTPVTWANGDTLAFTFKVPIVGWSSNSSMSSDTDTRVVAFSGYASTGTITGTLTAITMGNILTDTHSGYSGTTYTIPVSGVYDLDGSICCQPTGTTTGTLFGQIQKNGATVVPQVATPFAFSGAQIFTLPIVANGIQCKAGDTITILAYQNSGVTTNISSVSLSVVRRSGPSVIAATESVNMRYTDTSGASIGTSLAAYSFTTKSYDSHAAYSGSTYTAPVSGKYAVKANIYTNAVTLTTSQLIQIAIYHNGAIYSNSIVHGNGTNNSYSVLIADSVSCLAGDTIQIYAFSSVATNATAGSAANWVAIERIGN